MSRAEAYAQVRDPRKIRQLTPQMPLRNDLAEKEGFEPSKEALPPYSLSRRAPSTDSATSPVDN